MVVIPDSDIYLLKSPLQIDNKNQITFATATAQYNYFVSLPKLELEDATYLRKDGVLRFNGNFEDLIQYNYCMYKNTHYSNKWFYAFVVGMEYKNDNCTYIYLKTDVFQSWQFDLTYKASFVEREMLAKNSDTPRRKPYSGIFRGRGIQSRKHHRCFRFRTCLYYCIQ